MTFAVPHNNYSITVGTSADAIAVPIYNTRAPTVSDSRYPIGKRWIDTVANAEYCLTSMTASANPQALWVSLGGGSSNVNQLQGDSGGAISPSGGIITLAGTTNQITTTGTGSTIIFSIPNTFVAPGSVEVTSGFSVDAGPVTIATGTSTINISTDAAATIIRLGTGAGAKALTIGSSNTSSITTIDSGGGGAFFGTTAVSHTTTLGGQTGASQTIVNSGSAGILLATSSNGSLTVTSGTGTINISNDATNTTFNLGTGAGVKTVTLGSATASSSVNMQFPTGQGVSFNGSLRLITGSGSPNGAVTAPIGSFYLRSDPAGATSRLYVNTDAGTTWTNITCAA